jgi:tryptophan 2,3-dioxygenase
MSSQTTCPFGGSTKPSYWDYLHLDKLLTSQDGGQSRAGQGLLHHDEHLFITVHQVFELWFKQCLHDLLDVQRRLKGDGEEQDYRFTEDDAVMCGRRLERVNAILRHSVGIFDLLETMTPADFLEFREHLNPASGFQSFQMRQMEACLGLRDESRFGVGKRYQSHFTEEMKKSFEAVRQEPSLRELVELWLARVPVPERYLPELLRCKKAHLTHELRLHQLNSDPSSDEDLERLADEQMQSTRDKLTSHSCVAALFFMSYADHPRVAPFARVLDLLVAIEQAFLLWRNRHSRLVEREIGRRIGTGGSSGVAYLDSTLQYRVFEDLWILRTFMIKPSLLPSLEALQSHV